MSSLLQKLENNEAVLLMYLAGELPDADRAEVEQMLAGDASMRMTLAELAAMQDQTNAVFASADSAAHYSRREFAVREVGKAINAAKIEAMHKPQPAAKKEHGRFAIPAWAYPVAAAAMLVIGFMVFSNNRPAVVNTPAPVEVAIAPNDDPVPIIPAVATDDSLSRLEQRFLSPNDLDLFGGASDSDK